MSSPSTEYKPHPTAIPGLIVFDVTSMADERGYFQEKYQKEKLVAAGMPGTFEALQTNITYSKQAGVTRGMHGEPWDKYISVVIGKVFLAFVDLRAGASFGKLATVAVDPDKAVFCPKGVATSYQTLESNTYYIYSINSFRPPELMAQAKFVNVADPTLAIPWPIPLDQAVVSDKDRAHPFIKDVKPVEA